MVRVSSVYLVGFMGSGKSSAGRLLADRFDCPFVDLDEVIEAVFGMEIPEIFASFEEERFRIAESEQLRRTGEITPQVVATGGGAFCRKENRQIIRESGGVSVFLEVPWEIIVRRLPGTNTDRPMFGDVARARELYEARLRWYRKATLSVAVTAHQSPAEVAANVAVLLAEVPCGT